MQPYSYQGKVLNFSSPFCGQFLLSKIIKFFKNFYECFVCLKTIYPTPCKENVQKKDVFRTSKSINRPNNLGQLIYERFLDWIGM